MATTLEQATEDFYAALGAMLAGDAGPVCALWSTRDDVTYMSPFGEVLVGWDPIRASWERQAEQRLGGEVHAEDLHYLASDELGIVVGFERGTVDIDGAPRAVDIRATSLWRREDGHWAMVGHHTDPLA
jgi:ketosteroid isomerase-like protein